MAEVFKMDLKLALLIVCLLHIRGGLTAGGSAGDSLNFLIVGDWGGAPIFPYETPFEVAVAKQMARTTRKYGCSFNLAVGDNFYSHGVKDVHDKRFKETFENVYHYSELYNPWYVVGGNHDHYGNISAQIAYSKVSSRWNFPDLYYSKKFAVPGGKSLHVVMLDTVTLVGNTRADMYADQPKGPVDVQAAEDQWSWLEEEFRTSDADYLIAAGHFPVYSIAEHGPTHQLVERLDPLLHKYNVTAYLNGHDHNLQHLQTTSGGSTVNYFVVGAGDIVQNSVAHENSVPPGSLKYFWAELIDLGGFAMMEATPSALKLTFIDGFGRSVYHTTMSPRK